ncbi:MAG: hypothetical protein AAF152_16420 [Cyanobacteria bacterium P01_A01_bin.114]
MIQPNLATQPDSETIDQALSDEQFQISPLIRITLLGLYIALVIPLPFLATVTHAPIPAWTLWIAVGIGGLLLYGGLSERVEIDNTQIRVTYPGWIRGILRRGWSLSWSDIAALKPRSTGQGGLVYYFVTAQADRAYLLPMRVVGFTRLVQRVEAKTGIDTRDVKPLAQPWMYLILLGVTVLLLGVDIWTIWTAVG